MPTFYNFIENGLIYSFDDIFIPADLFREGNLWVWGNGSLGRLGTNDITNVSTPVTTLLGGTNWKSIACGRGHTAAIKTDGTLWTWGNSTDGQLGTNDTITRSTPSTTFAGGTDWKQVSAGYSHTAAIKTDGTLWTWGSGDSGRLGNFATTNRSTPVTTFAGGTNWKQVSAGSFHIAAVKTDGTLWSWGNGGSGRLGNNNTTNRSTPVTTTTGGTNWKQVSAGREHTAAIKTDGTLWTWGSNFNSELGRFTNVLIPVTTFAGGTNWDDVEKDLYTISAGDEHTSAIKTDGTLWTWGYGGVGSLGTNDTTNKSTPVTTFAGGTNWKQVSGGGSHTAAIKTDGTLWTWGTGSSGQLGNFSSSNRSTPVTTTTGGSNWKQVSSGSSHTVAVKIDGTLWTWGRNNSGQLGNFDTTNRSTPVTTTTGGTNWKQVSAGDNYTAAIKTDGTLWVWGLGSYGQLGNFAATNRSTPVTTFAGGTDWKQVSCGRYHMAAVKTDGTLWAWGESNITGKLGNNQATISNRSTPVTTFAGGTNWKQVSAGKDHTSAVKTDGTLWVWGYNIRGQLGINNLTTKSTPVTTFAGGTNWKQVSAGNDYTIALKDNKELYVFGNNDRVRLGTNDSTNRSTPVTTFAGGTNWDDVEKDLYTISAGGQHTIAVKTDGTLWIWGNASNGKLGTNDLTPNRSTPVTTFVGGTNWTQVSTGYRHSAAIKTDGTLWTWGNDGQGRLGRIDILPYRETPVTTFAGGNNWADTPTTEPEDLHTLSAESVHNTAAIKTDGTLWIWGNSFSGALGNNIVSNTIRISTPITTFAGGTNWKQINMKGGTASAIKTDGTLWIWGAGNQLNAVLGTNDILIKYTPVTTFAGGTNWKQVDTSGVHTLAIKTDGTLWAWGNGRDDKLGNNDTTIKSTPVTTVAGGTNWKHVSVAYKHTAAIKTDGTLWTWGNSYAGVLGRLSAFEWRETPVTTFAGGTNWADTATTEPEDLYTLSAGNLNTAAVKTDGTLWTWGRGNYGQLGNFAGTDRSTPITTFAGGTDWKQVSVGRFHTAAVKTDGTLWSWGYGGYGRLGNFATTDRSTPVTTFAGGTNWKQVSGGGFHTAAVKTDGTLWVWGNGGGGCLGNFATTNRSTPVTTFAGGIDWKQVSSGYHTSAIKTDGTLWTWGDGSSGRLGNASTTDRSTPVTTFAGGTDWKQVSNGLNHTAAIKTDGTLWTWGYLDSGRLGNAVVSFTLVSTPITTFAGGTNWKQVSAGGGIAGSGGHTAAIKTDGTLWVWGSGTFGILGTNDEIDRSTPVTTFAGGTNWKQVSAGKEHIVALKDDGVNKELYVFGINSDQQLGINHGFDTQDEVGGTNWKQVSCSQFHTTAIKTDGTLWTWGSGGDAKLGTNDTTTKFTPVTTFAGGTNWKQVSSGLNHTAAVKTDGTLWTWGLGDLGQLGNKDLNIRSTPITTFAGGTNWKQVSAGYVHTAALKDDGVNKELYVFGGTGDQQLGINYDPSSYFYPGIISSNQVNWKQVSLGFEHSLAINTDGTLWAWGVGSFGRLGTGGYDNKTTPVTTFAGGTNWKQVSGGGSHTAAIKTDGTLWTWGISTTGQLGRLSALDYRMTPITTFAGGNNWKDIEEYLYILSAGMDHTTAIKTDGTLWIWGRGSYGRLGTNDTITRSTPVTTFAGGTNWKQISAGYKHTAAIKTDGTLWTWGRGVDRQLGDAANANRSTPVTTFAGGTDWAQVSSGFYHTSAIKTDGTLWTWGTEFGGQLGTNFGPNRSTPTTTFAGGTNWAQVSSGPLTTAAVKTDGTLWIWGSGSFGELGNGGYSSSGTPVTTFAGGTNWKQVSIGYYVSAAVKTDGTLWMWGRGTSGQLGTNDTIIRITPVTTFAGGINWKQIDVSPGTVANVNRHTAAIKTDGTLWTWGSGALGKLGTNDTIDRLTPVTTFTGGTNWKQVSCGGYEYTIALKDDGVNKELYVWGSNSSVQLGTNDTITRSTPVTTFAGGTNWADAVSSNPEDLYTISGSESEHSAAIKTDGTLWVWGNNVLYGQLGTNDTIDRSTPVTTFAGGTNWKQISLGDNYTTAIKTDGTLWTWGYGRFGRHGTNDAGTRRTPVTTFAGGTNWKQVSAGYATTTAIKTDGTLWVWGLGGFGRLGINDTLFRLTPVTTFAGGTDWKQVSSGFYHTSAIKTDGTLWTWGYNTSAARLGTNDTTIKSTPVTTFAGGTNWKQVSCTGRGTVAVKTDGTLWVWGPGGQGTNDTTIKSTPVTTFAGGTNWKQATINAAIKTDGTLWTWGGTTFGDLGTNDTIIRLTPVTTFAGGTNWKQVNRGDDYVLALSDDGINKELYVFGDNRNNQLGINYSPYDQDEVGGTNWKQVSCSQSNTAAIKTDGTLWTWGSGAYGILGTNSTITRITPVTTFAGGTDWKQVSSGDDHTAAIKTDGTLWTWGRNIEGQLGNASTVNVSTPVTTFAGGTNWKQVSAGYYHTVALKDDGVNKELYVFGNNVWGQIGNAQVSSSISTPTQVLGNYLDWKQVDAGNTHTAAVKTDGTLWVWGNGGSGRLGNGITTNISTPITTFTGGIDWKQVSAGYDHTAAVKTNGTLWTWGNNNSGQLGTNDEIDRSTPVTTAAGGTNWKQVDVGSYHTSAVTYLDSPDNPPDLFRLFTWGYGFTAALGNANTTSRSTPITTFAGGSNWRQVSIARDVTGAIKTDGTLWLWGDAALSALGNALTTGLFSTPITTFAGGTNWKQVSLETYQGAAIKTDGTLWVWGIGTNGKLGNNNSTNRSTPVTTFAGGTNWKQISCGRQHTAAIKTDGTLWLWGGAYSSGELGINNTIAKISTPVTTFAGGTNWKQVSAGYAHSAAIKTDGTLWVWGAGNSARLGVNSLGDKLTPVTTFAGGTNWNQVSCGSLHIAAIKTDGTLWTWGDNLDGALGNGVTTGSISTPVTTFAGGTNWKQVGAGGYYTAAIKTDGTLWVWGTNDDGRLGNTLVIGGTSTPTTTFAGGTNWESLECGYNRIGAIKKN